MEVYKGANEPLVGDGVVIFIGLLIFDDAARVGAAGARIVAFPTPLLSRVRSTRFSVSPYTDQTRTAEIMARHASIYFG
jgi:hypothetical protein